MKKSFVILLMVLIGLTLFAIGVKFTQDILIVDWDFVAPESLYSGDRPLAIPALRHIKDIPNYVDRNISSLMLAFQEDDPQRVRALFAMYEVHTASLYGIVVNRPSNLDQFLNTPYADCGTFTGAELTVMRELGLQVRAINISGGTHVFAEAKIGDHWEVFDATSNVWIDTSAFEMMTGKERVSRAFYTPELDRAYAGKLDLSSQRVAQELRIMLPGLGSFYFPKAVLYEE